MGRFQIRACLGAGAFGTVYRAYDPQLDREVALKVPNASVLDSPARVARFLREARAAANLRHPHIVPVYDAGEADGRPFIASAFIQGCKLSEGIEEGGMDLRRAARLARELAEALAYAHEQGIVHRDVKPDNVMLDERDQIHLMDFGLAARQDEEGRLTSEGAVLGTPRYMAPEQARGQEGEARPGADQYSAGIVLYELLCGDVPFRGPVTVVIHSHIHEQPAPPSRHRPGLPKDLETICLKAIAKRPEDRYADCGALADDLRRWLDGEPIAARRLGPLAQLARWAVANKAVAALGATAVLLLVAGTVVSSWFAAEAGRSERSALTALDAAEKARGEAVTSQHAAEQSQADLRNTLYCANLQLLQSAWHLGHVDRVQRLLAENSPAPGGEDLRGIEWYYWNNILDQRTVPLGRYRETWALAAAFGPDENTVFSGHNTGNIRRWTLKSIDGKKGGESHEFAAHRGSVHGLAYARKNKWLASAGADGVVKVWSGPSLDEQKVVTTGKLPWRTLALSPDESWLAGCDWAGSVTVWKTADWSQWHTFPPDAKGEVSPAFVCGLAFSLKGDRLYAARATPHVVGWSLNQRTETVRFRAEGLAGVRSVAVSSDGRLLATGDLLGRVAVWDAQTGQLKSRRDSHEGPVSGVAWVRGGRVVASSGVDQVVHLWHTGTNTHHTFRGHGAQIETMAVSADGRFLATAGYDGLVFHWNAAQRQEFSSVDPKDSGQYASACFSADGRVVAGSDEGFLDVFSANGKLEGSLEIAEEPVQALAPVPASTLVVAGSKSGKAALVDVATRQILRRWDVPGEIKDLCVSPDGSHAAAACWDKTCRVWELQTEREVFALPHRSEVFAVAYSPDGATLATACSVVNHPDARDLLSVYDARTGECRYTRDKLRDRTLSLAFTGDGGQILLAGGWQATPSRTAIVNLADGKMVGELTGHNESVSRVAITRDGRRAVTAAHDKTVRVWDLRGRGEVLVVTCDRALEHVAVAADDSAIAAVDQNGKLIVLVCPRPRGESSGSQ